MAVPARISLSRPLWALPFSRVSYLSARLASCYDHDHARICHSSPNAEFHVFVVGLVRSSHEPVDASRYCETLVVTWLQTRHPTLRMAAFRRRRFLRPCYRMHSRFLFFSRRRSRHRDVSDDRVLGSLLRRNETLLEVIGETRPPNKRLRTRRRRSTSKRRHNTRQDWKENDLEMSEKKKRLADARVFPSP